MKTPIQPCFGIGLALLLAITTASSHAQVIIADFESPTYTAGNTLNGTNGWVNISGNDSSRRVTPDTLNSGYTFVMEGQQSAYYTGIATKAFSSVAGLTAPDLVEISWLLTAPDPPLDGNSYGGMWVLADVSLTGTYTAGIFLGANLSENSYNIYTDNTNSSDTGVTIVSGGGGAPSLNRVYEFKIVFDFVNQDFESFYRDWTNNTGFATLGVRNLQTTISGASLLANGGIKLESAGYPMGIDQIVAVPEPSSFAMLLALGLLAFGFVRAKRKA